MALPSPLISCNSVNSIFNPEFIDNLYPRSAENRKSLIADARATNYGVVRLELIEHLYEKMYEQRREFGTDESKWPHRILGATDIVGASSDDTNQETLRLQLRNLREQTDYLLDVDLVIAATGYKRTGHLTMLDEGVSKLLPEVATGSTEIKMNVKGLEQKNVKVGRDYSVQFAPGKVARGSGIWLQGCNEATHGVSLIFPLVAPTFNVFWILTYHLFTQLSDTLLSVLACRSDEIVNSIFGAGFPKTMAKL